MKEEVIQLEASLRTTFWNSELRLNEAYKFSALFLINQSIE